MVFTFEALLSDAPDDEVSQRNDLESWQYWHGLPPARIREEVNRLLAEYSFEVIPYRQNAELTVLASAFISDTEDGLLFRVYVPSGRIWANETDRLLQLFQDYLARVGHQSVRLDQHRTERGIVYELYGDQGLVQNKSTGHPFVQEFRDFSQLLDLAVSNPSKAEVLLKDRNVDVREVVGILTRYAKEAKRLQVDLRHEREQKVLSIRHRLESELVDALPPNVTFDDIGTLVEKAIPPIAGIATAIGGEQRSLPLSVGEGSNLTINLKPQIIQTVNAVVAHEINGDIYLTENDQRLLELISQHGGDRKTELASSVRELADETAPKSGRLQAKQRLKGFLWQLASKAPDVGIGILQAYLENRMGL